MIILITELIPRSITILVLIFDLKFPLILILITKSDIY